MSRHDLSDFEWGAIERLPPQKSRSVPRVDDRRVLSGIFWRFRTSLVLGGPAGALWAADHLLQSVRALAGGRDLGPAARRDDRGL